MSYSFTLGPLADQSRMIRMGDRFRGGSEAIDVGQIVTFALIFTAMALVLWLMTGGAGMYSRFRRRSPTMLFWELWLIAKNAQHCYGRDRVISG